MVIAAEGVVPQDVELNVDNNPSFEPELSRKSSKRRTSVAVTVTINEFDSDVVTSDGSKKNELVYPFTTSFKRCLYSKTAVPPTPIALDKLSWVFIKYVPVSLNFNEPSANNITGSKIVPDAGPKEISISIANPDGT